MQFSTQVNFSRRYGKLIGNSISELRYELKKYMILLIQNKNMMIK